MKKIVALISTLIFTILLVGCGAKTLTFTEDGKVTSEELIKSIKNIHQDSGIYYTKEKSRLTIELDYKNSDYKTVYNEFEDDENKIVAMKETFLEYKNISEVVLKPLVDKQALACADTYVLDKGEMSILYTKEVTEEVIKTSLEIQNGTYSPKVDEKEEVNTNETPDNIDTISLPSEGEFKDEKLIKELNIGNTGLKYSKFKVEDGVIKIDLLYRKRVLTKGVVKEIQDKISNALGSKGCEIELSISQEKPIDEYSCKYNGSWSQ